MTMAPHPGPSALIEEKRTLRRAMAERREGLSADEGRARAARASSRLLGLPELALGGGGTVSGYVAIRGEIDPAAVLQAARAAGAAVVLPRISAEPPRLRFHRVGADAPMAVGRWGTIEPHPDAVSCPELPADKIDVMIVPGLAFDARGRRVGYGGGYYDEAGGRVRAAGGVLVGFAYDFQIVDHCPTGEGDVAVDMVVTDRRVLRGRPGAPE
jgi:5-formyltetrahydrofolate cyclo-ligase